MYKMTRERFKEVCGNDKAYLYIVRLYNEEESFYKVGITSKENTHERLRSFPYKYEIIEILSHTSSDFIIGLEEKLISLEDKYRPIIGFPGQSECVSSIDNIKEFIESLHWVVGLELHTAPKRRVIHSISVTRMLKEYKDNQHRISHCTLSEDAEGLEEAQSSLEVFLQTNPEFDEWISAGVTIANINTAGKSRERINRLAETKRILASHSDAIIYDLDLKIGGVYSVKHLKEAIQKYYDTAGILKTAKATDITQWFEVSKTSFMKDGKKLNALRIVAPQSAYSICLLLCKKFFIFQ